MMLTPTEDLNSIYGFTEIVFADNFSSGVPDKAKWNIQVSSRQKNFEEQAYINSDETIYILQKSGVLDFDGHALAIHPRYRPGYRSADGKHMTLSRVRVDTFGKFDFTYGLISARMNFPRAKDCGRLFGYWVTIDGRTAVKLILWRMLGILSGLAQAFMARDIQ